MSDGEHGEGRRERTGNTRVAVEAAIDFSKGANRDTWEVNRSKMSGSISPWRSGGFFIEERFSDTTEEI
jgi:hypothetical protein